MSVHEPSPFRTSGGAIDPQRAVKFGVGVTAAPLWAAYFALAGAGVAYWWMTAWSRREPKSFAPWAPRAALVPAPEPAELRPARTPQSAETVAAPTSAEPVRPVEMQTPVKPEPAPHAAASEPAPQPEAKAAAPEPARQPAKTAKPEPAPETPAAAAHAARLGDTLAAAAPVAAGLEPPVEPEQTAELFDGGAGPGKASAKKAAAPKRKSESKPS